MTGPNPPNAQPVNVGGASTVQRRLKLMKWYRGFVPPGRSSPLDLLMIQPTAFCNIDCSYCYLPYRSKKGQFPLDLLEPLFGKLLDAGLLGELLSVLWHAGEPMVLPAAYYAEAIDRITRLTNSTSRTAHFIQTNGTLITQEWCDLIRAKGIRVGVSIDGPEHIHDAHRVTRSRKGTFAEVMKGIELLKKNGILFTVIAVVTARSVDNPDEMYDFFKAIGSAQTGFNVDEVEGGNATSSLAGPDMEARFRRFMSRVLHRSLEDRAPTRIREFANGLNQSNAVLLGHPTFSSEANPFSILSCDMNGKLFTFSPELVDLTKTTGGDYSIGDIQSVEFDRIYQEPRFAEMNAEVLAGVTQCRKSCSYFPVCGGGAPVNKMAENGSFDSTETMFCRYKYKVVADVLDDHVLSAIASRRQKNVLGVSDTPDAAPQRAHVDDGVLAPGFPVLVALSPASRLLLSDGTGGPEAAPDSDRYESQARLPLNSWRPPRNEEMATLGSEEAKPDSLAFVAIVRPPGQLLAPLLAITSELTSKPIELRGIDGTVAPVIDEVGAELAKLFAEAGRPHRTLGISLVAPGFTTTAVDFSTNRRLGLHVDSGPESAPRMRAQTPNRISVNLGKEPRRLLFLNLSLAQVIARLPADVVNDPANSPTDLARVFLRTFPRYPVLSLEIEPGEAYIAPTENMIHDGYTGHMASPDASLSVLGHFKRPGSKTG